MLLASKIVTFETFLPSSDIRCENCLTNKYFRQVCWLVGWRFKSNCPLVAPARIGGMPSVGVFLRDANPYLREFRRKPRKTPNG